MISFDINAGYFLSGSASKINAPVVSTDITVTIYPAWLKEIDLQWDVPSEWGDPFFNVYKSESTQTGFERINTQPISGNTWVDRTTKQDSTHRSDYYIVEAQLSTGELYRSPVASVSTRRNSHAKVHANEISRRESLMLRKFLGVPVLLFKRRTYGLRCRECWSEKYEKLMKSGCKTCLGTGFEGGYFPAVISYFQFEPSQKHLQFTYMGKTETNHTSVWTTSLPRLDSYDVIVRLYDYKIFNLEQVRQTELQGHTVRQMAAAVELSHNAPEHRLIERFNLQDAQYNVVGLLPPYDTDTAGYLVKGGG